MICTPACVFVIHPTWHDKHSLLAEYCCVPTVQTQNAALAMHVAAVHAVIIKQWSQSQNTCTVHMCAKSKWWIYCTHTPCKLVVSDNRQIVTCCVSGSGITSKSSSDRNSPFNCWAGIASADKVDTGRSCTCIAACSNLLAASGHPGRRL